MSLMQAKPFALDGLPPLNESGVYFLWRKQEIVYVGQAKDLRRRIGQHLAEGLKAFDGLSFVLCEIGGLDRLERHYIQLHAPLYNNCAHGRQAKQFRKVGVRFEQPSPVVRRRRRGRHSQGPTLVIVEDSHTISRSR